MTRDELFKLAVAATPGILALAWNVWKHYADRGDRIREKALARSEQVNSVDLIVVARPSRPSGAELRVVNDGEREVYLESVHLCYGEENLVRPVLHGDTFVFGKYAGIPFRSDVPKTEPLKPRQTRDYRIELNDQQVAAILDNLEKKRTWISARSTTREVLHLKHDEIEWALRRICTERGRTEVVQNEPVLG
jgi:hypothetical protein